ncbi:sacsin N-terminal ATP-binding-like domain-containing protein [Dyadobacter psychrophilus]|uniref:Sacsin/Nov domain-containing protein n=1 Tax=Dyadobacter psychrophilus TaxID=651661 RepID=A0A1T5DD01_9BACT|nr:hypothetical protein [Dyadobacter psychrophilus]SKB69584.1 hypothetical protein SAMN05660293_01536 [Dyadobacter psychrophilus]
MLKTLPQSDLEYKEILRTLWNLDIDNNELIGTYSLSKTGSAGFLSNCTSIGGRRLKYPEDKYPLSVMVPENVQEEMVVGERYRFKVQFAALQRRLKFHPYLLTILTDSLSLIGNKASVQTSIPPQVARDLSEVIQEIYKEKLDQNYPNNVIDIAEAVEALAIDIYSENKRFIYELIQNADDAATKFGSELVIETKAGFVILSHNGKPFDEKDLRGLCGIGRGTKRDDETKTGYKGIGFKSVFGQRDGLVFVKSKDLLFRFDKTYMQANGWNKRWGNQSVWERANSSKFKSPWQLIPILSESSNHFEVDEILNNENFTVKTAIKVENETELTKDINELFDDARFLLFLRKIHKVTFRHQSSSIIIKKESHAQKDKMFSLLKNENVISSWYLKTMNHPIPSNIRQGLRDDSKSPKKLQEMDRAELSFAFLLGNDLSSIQVLKKVDSCIFTYLPTTVKEFEFPFLVNANFLVDAGREKLHKDRIWNQWLFKVIGYELIKCCADFTSIEELKCDFVKGLVPAYFPNGNKLMEWFNDGLQVGFDKIKFIPNRNGDLALLSEIVIDKVNLIGHEVTNLDSISAFVNANSAGDFVVNDNILPPFTDFDKLINFGAKTFSDEDLKLFFQSDFFLSTHQIEQNFNLLMFLKELDRGSVNGEWNYIIRNNTYIFSDNDSLEKIPLVCFPLKVYKTDFGAEMTLIHSKVFELISRNPDVLAWLKSFDVKEPSEIAYLEKEIIGKFDTAINEENFIEVTEFILKMHLAKKLLKNHYDQLQDLPLKTNNKFCKAKDSFLHKDYNPTINFSEYLSGLNVLSEIYIGNYNANEWKSFLSLINVGDDIRLIENYHLSTLDINTKYLNDALVFAKTGHTYPHLINKTNPYGTAIPVFINYFTFFTKITHFSYSEIFWNRIVNIYSVSIVGSQAVTQNYGADRKQFVYKLNSVKISSLDSMGWGYYPNNRTYIPSYIFWQLKNVACIPTNQGNCRLADEVYTNSERIKSLGGKYLPIVQIEKELSKEWVQLIGLKSKLSLTEYLELLTSICHDTNKNNEVKYDNIERIGLIYNELIDIV